MQLLCLTLCDSTVSENKRASEKGIKSGYCCGTSQPMIEHRHQLAPAWHGMVEEGLWQMLIDIVEVRRDLSKLTDLQHVEAVFFMALQTMSVFNFLSSIAHMTAIAS